MDPQHQPAVFHHVFDSVDKGEEGCRLDSGHQEDQHRSTLDTEQFSSLIRPASSRPDGDSRSLPKALVVCLDAHVAQ